MPADRPVDHWRSEFGDQYIDRNDPGLSNVRQRTMIWGRYLWPIAGDLPKSMLEVGSNVGINLRALHNLVDADLTAIEPNPKAREVVIKDGVLPADKMLDGEANKLPIETGAVEMSFTIGVLIHVPPSELDDAMDELYRVSSKYILISEYFASEPEEKQYHGHSGLLFKRDFGKHMLSRHPDLSVVDYGFLWRGACASDDSNWWLFKKS